MGADIKYRLEYKDGNNYKPLFPQTYPQYVELKGLAGFDLTNCWGLRLLKSKILIPPFNLGVQTIDVRITSFTAFYEEFGYIRVYPYINNDKSQAAWDSIDQVQCIRKNNSTLQLSILRLYKAGTVPILVDVCYFPLINQKGAPLYG